MDSQGTSGNDGQWRKNKKFKHVEDFIDLVTSQPMGDLVIVLQEGEHPLSALSKSLRQYRKDLRLRFIQTPKSSEFVIRLNGKDLVSGSFDNRKEASLVLAWCAINKFSQKHFTILKKTANLIQVPNNFVESQKKVSQTAKPKEDSDDVSDTTELEEDNADSLDTAKPEENGAEALQVAKPEENGAEALQVAKPEENGAGKLASAKSEDDSADALDTAKPEDDSASALDTAKPEAADASHYAGSSNIHVQKGLEQSIQITSDVGSLTGSVAHKMMLKMGWRGGGLGAREQGITERILPNQARSSNIHKPKVVKESLEVTTDVGSLAGSTAHKMMMKMGWTGRGLGVQEQGITDRILPNENVERLGLGHGDISKEIKQLIVDYSKSNKCTGLAFSKDFTKDERALIHKFCEVFDNLKTKSRGKGEQRYITITREVEKMDIVRMLLKSHGENDYYKLFIPDDYMFAHRQMFSRRRRKFRRRRR